MLATMRFRFSRPSGDLMWLALAFLIGGPYWCWVGVDIEQQLLVGLGVVLTIIGGGIWFEKLWARWAGLVLMCFVAAWQITQLINGSAPARKGLVLIGCAFFIWSLWRWRTSRSCDKPLTSLVLLLRRARGLNRKMLAESAAAAWGTQFSEDDDAQNFVVGESPIFLIKNDRATFMVHNHNTPYFDDTEKAAEEINELRVGNAIREHNAWVAVDLMDGGGRFPSPAEAYPEIARLVAELSGPDCTAIFCPETSAINVYDDTLEEKLRGPDPLSAVREPSYAPIVSISDDDPRMKAAVEEARQRWPDFVEAFQRRQDGQHFAVKAPVTKGGQTEFIWLSVTRIEGNNIHGNLDNDPMNPDLKSGDPVTVPFKDLNDWAYSEGEKVVGPFTLKVLEEAARERRSQQS
jgi:uncharacterized protein YegJ (DUF2314 family)